MLCLAGEREVWDRRGAARRGVVGRAHCGGLLYPLTVFVEGQGRLREDG